MTSDINHRLTALSAVSAAAATGLWTGIVVQQWPHLLLAGTLCGDHASLVGHCPACYPAAALTVVAVVAGLARLARGWGRAAVLSV